jgi:hypothetical protein
MVSLISHKAIDAYRKVFPGDNCAYGEPGSLVFVEPEGSDDAYLQPCDETEAIFLDRIERSRKAGRNLFCEEWPRFKYKKGCLY